MRHRYSVARTVATSISFELENESNGRYWPKAAVQDPVFSPICMSAIEQSRRSKSKLRNFTSEWLLYARKQPLGQMAANDPKRPYCERQLWVGFCKYRWISTHNIYTRYTPTNPKPGKTGLCNTPHKNPQAPAFAIHPEFPRILCNSLPKRSHFLTGLRKTSL